MWLRSQVAVIYHFLLFRFYNNVGHCFYNQRRMLAHSGFATQHYCISSFQYRIGHIGDLTAVRTRTIHHTFHHLRGNDHRFGTVYTFAHDLFLYIGNALQRQLYTQVATGYHYGIRCNNDITQVFQRFWFFYFCNNLGSAVLRFNQCT
ncbi:hypothetical protein D3C86_1559760 [compost metagenome]